MSKHDWPKVRERKVNVKGRDYSYYYVDLGMVDGKRRTKNFKHEKRKAELWAEKKRIERAKIGADAMRLSDNQKRDAVEALRILKNSDTLKAAASYFIKHNQPACTKRTVKQVVSEYIQEAQDDNLREASIQDLKNRLGRFDDAFGDESIGDITGNEILDWSKSKHTAKKDGEAISALTRKHYLTVAGGLINYALEQSYISRNPLTKKSRRRRNRDGLQNERLPEILSVKEIRATVAAADAHVPAMLPAILIGFFAGVRTKELRELEWKNVNLDKKLITIPPTIAKGRSVRHIQIQANLFAWLVACKKESKFVALQGTAWRYGFDKVRSLAKIDPWPHNAMRHSFATYHLAMFEDQNKTALELGHRDTTMLFRHYRALATKQDAEDFWSIKPGKRDVIQFARNVG